jgi:hypothetical protein
LKEGVAALGAVVAVFADIGFAVVAVSPEPELGGFGVVVEDDEMFEGEFSEFEVKGASGLVVGQLRHGNREDLNAAFFGDGMHREGFISDGNAMRLVDLIPAKFVEECFEVEVAKCSFGGIG